MLHRCAALLVVVLLGLLGAAPAALAAPASPAAPDQTACPQVNQPGPPVDASEAPRPGGAAPAPLPVPAEPVGGEQMGTCDVAVPSGAPAPPEVGVQSYVVADLDTGAVLAAKVPHARLRPASLLKTLTGLLVARQVPMDQVLTGTQDDANQEGTRVGIGPGGQYTVRQLFDAMLMASGNDAAHALAVRLTGSVPATVDLMNRTAAQIGALDTRAATPSGLDGPGQSSSAYDLASIFRLGMQEPAFAQAVGTRQIQFPGFGPTPPFAVDNDNKIFRYPGALGGKTGFTDDARHTYIGAQERGGRRLVVVLMHGEQRPVPMVEQGLALLDYGYALPRDASVGQLTERGPGNVAASSDASSTTTVDTPDSPATGDTSWGTWLALGGVVVLGLVVVVARYRHRV
ncbi:D-alanyl-D-alanine carboxypeptidase family protein [Actinomycetospora soli]|uniref:D-alanyl-D-alanine carboxypeptidase family protein n=1 Tax=Actinomycetospora soli TaxID=2893887 RepID=UPI001E31EB13|nr:D-alanyl-D-alanine carboxypeptidase family protein [Actinomycetospora soli]MCD2189338.1 D-alanyl-D-alanine carboxypeptidase [Actinomycetospora soli]